MPQFESLAGFSAVIDRLGQFQEAMDSTKAVAKNTAAPSTTSADEATLPARPEASPEPPSSLMWPGIRVTHVGAGDDRGSWSEGGPLLRLHGLTVVTPDGNNVLVQDLNLQVCVV
jgi:ABC-type uncharacterized transport system fused permease/ATPase subunit